MEDKYKVVLIVNCYNSENYINDTLDSLVNQNFNNYKIYCVDNLSKDGTKTIIQKWQKNSKSVNLIELEKHVPLVEARLKALSIIKPELNYDYFAFCDSDDLWKENWLSKLINASSGEDLLFSNGYEIKEDILIPVDNCMSKKVKDAFSSCLYLQSVLYSTELIKSDNYKLDKKLKMLSDMDLLINLKRSDNSYIHLSDRMFYYRVHKKSLASTKRIEVLKERYYITKKHKLSMIIFLIKGFFYLFGIYKYVSFVINKKLVK